MSFNVRKFRFTRKEELLAVQLIILCQFLGMSRARSRHRAFALFHERTDIEVLWALKSAGEYRRPSPRAVTMPGAAPALDEPGSDLVEAARTLNHDPYRPASRI
jgi:hypothetical protein